MLLLFRLAEQTVSYVPTDSARIKIFVPAAFEEDARIVLKEHRRHQAPLHLVED